MRPVSEKKWYTNKRIKNALEIGLPTFETISQVLAIPAYSWLNTNHLRNFRSDGLSRDKSCKEILNQQDNEKFKHFLKMITMQNFIFIL